ncbi:hypothetical protein ACLKA6_011513 [Drosophila palustris]
MREEEGHINGQHAAHAGARAATSVASEAPPPTVTDGQGKRERREEVTVIVAATQHSTTQRRADKRRLLRERFHGTDVQRAYMRLVKNRATTKQQTRQLATGNWQQADNLSSVLNSSSNSSNSGNSNTWQHL